MEKVIYILNLVLLFFIARFEDNSDSDKTIIITSFFYLGLIALNLLFGFVAQLDKKKIHRHYYYAALMLLISGLSLLYFW